MPPVPRTTFIVIEAEFALCGFEAFLDTPARSFDTDEALGRSALRAPCGEVGEFAIDQAASDQQASRPGA